ncbi:MAG: cytochrome c [Sandaracinaceae bacterium]
MTGWPRLLWLAPLLLVACGPGRRTFEAPVELNGVTVAPEVLNRGEMAYMRYCRGCHGQTGHGDGPYSSSMEPRPADLTTGRYRTMGDGELPSDAALMTLLEEGIDGTGMRPIAMTDEDRNAVVQYLKTLSPRWMNAQPSGS